MDDERDTSGGGAPLEKNPSGLYPDPEDPSRFHRRGRGRSRPRVVKRITVYVEDSVAREMDRVRAEEGKTTRSELVERALREYLDRQRERAAE